MKLHKAMNFNAGEDHGVSGVGSEQGTGRVIEGYWGVIRISNYTEGHRGECLGKVVSKSVIQKTVLWKTECEDHFILAWNSNTIYYLCDKWMW